MSHSELLNFTVYFVWYLGAVATVLILLVLLLGCLYVLVGAWKASFKDMRLNLWVYMAMRAYQRAGHLRPDKMPMVDEQRKLLRVAHHLIDTAREAGFVVTIATEPTQPLRMGGYSMEADVRPARQ